MGGAMRDSRRGAGRRILGLAGALALAAAASPAGAAEDIGEASAIANQVTGELDEQVRTLVVGSHVFHNEWIETAEASSAELIFIDETSISFGPKSRLKLDTFVFDPDPALGKVVVNMTEGAFRFATGSMRSSAYEIHTPVAIIGVRGTEIEIVVNPLDSSTTVKLVSGIAYITNCPTAPEEDQEELFGACVGGETRILDEEGLASTVFARDEPPTLPAPPDESFEDALNEMDELIVAALLEEGPAAGPQQAGGALPEVTAQPITTAENPSTLSSSPAQ
jgi:hypothetical protein